MNPRRHPAADIRLQRMTKIRLMLDFGQLRLERVLAAFCTAGSSVV